MPTLEKTTQSGGFFYTYLIIGEEGRDGVMRRSRQMFLLEGVYFISFCALYAYTVTILLDYGYTEV